MQMENLMDQSAPSEDPARSPFFSVEDLRKIAAQAFETSQRCKRWNLVLNLPDEQLTVYRSCQISLNHLLELLNPLGLPGFPDLAASVFLPVQDKKSAGNALGLIQMAAKSIARNLGFDLLDRSWPSEPVWGSGWRPPAIPAESSDTMALAADRLRELTTEGKAAESIELPTMPPAVALTEEDKTILETLADEFPMAVMQPDLAAKIHIDRHKIGERLQWLESKGFVERPEGTQRKGHAITLAGLFAIGRGGDQYQGSFTGT